MLHMFHEHVSHVFKYNKPSTLSMKPGRQSTKGYAQGSDLSVDKCASYELDGFYPGSAAVRA
jgi:hypothetical protein